jgi:hypothetical protein
MRLGSVELLRNCSDGLVALPARVQPGAGRRHGNQSNRALEKNETKRRVSRNTERK